MSNLTLTVLMLVYNEAPTIASLLDAIVAVSFDNQIVVTDEGSTDGTAEAAEGWITCTGRAIEVVRDPVTRGNGAAIRSGLKLAWEAITIVQDADPEYDPAEYSRLIGPILRNEADAVYGSRYLRPAGLPWGPNRVCVLLLNLVVRLLYGQALTDGGHNGDIPFRNRRMRDFAGLCGFEGRDWFSFFPMTEAGSVFTTGSCTTIWPAHGTGIEP